MSDEPASGGGRVRGSLLGGKRKREATGGLNCTVGDAIGESVGLAIMPLRIGGVW